MPFASKRLEVSLEGLAGQGIGRYGTAGFPDVTLDPTTGEMRPLSQARLMGGLVYHHGSRLDVFAYGGDDHGAAGVPFTDRDRCGLRVSSGELRELYERSGAEYMPRRQSEHLRGDDWLLVSPLSRRVRLDRVRKPGHVRASQPMERYGNTPDGRNIVVYSTLRFDLP